ncbi:MAG: sarcosine oxidase subunit gamma [Litorivicinus sp.]
MDKLMARSALGRADLMDRQVGAYRIIEQAPALVSCAVRRNQQVALEEKLPGLPVVGGVSEIDAMVAFWTGPGQWMLEMPYHSERDPAAHWADQLLGLASVTEQTDAWVRFDVTGALAPMFERLAMIDWRSFGVGQVQRGALEHLGCFFLRRTVETLSVYGPRSSAATLLHALEQAARRVSQ